MRSCQIKISASCVAPSIGHHGVMSSYRYLFFPSFTFSTRMRYIPRIRGDQFLVYLRAGIARLSGLDLPRDIFHFLLCAHEPGSNNPPLHTPIIHRVPSSPHNTPAARMSSRNDHNQSISPKILSAQIGSTCYSCPCAENLPTPQLSCVNSIAIAKRHFGGGSDVSYCRRTREPAALARPQTPFAQGGS